MKVIGIIPARYASTRFPGKPLIDIAGKSMIQRVYEQCEKVAMLTDVIVATDDERINTHVKQFGGKVVLTSAHHQSGTDRCAEAIVNYASDCDVIINIQGDEPFINPKQIELVASAFAEPKTQIASLIKLLTNEEDIRNPNVVKVIKNIEANAIYFSRNPIPYRRNPEAKITYYKHIGIYGYTLQTLKKITTLPTSLLENAENLEQLRWIENSISIKLLETELETIAIDTPDDLAKVLEGMNK